MSQTTWTVLESAIMFGLVLWAFAWGARLGWLWRDEQLARQIKRFQRDVGRGLEAALRECDPECDLSVELALDDEFTRLERDIFGDDPPRRVS